MLDSPCDIKKNKKKSPQVGLEPTKMRHDLKKSVSILPEGEEKIISFISDFRMYLIKRKRPVKELPDK